MDKKTKIILSVLAVGLTATATFFIIRKIKRKKLEQKLVGGELDQTRIDEIQATPLSVANPPLTTEFQAVVMSQPMDLFIKTQADGNAFRKWVNDNHNAYARQIDLDPTGSHTNSYFEKAWKKYGGEYIAENGGLIAIASAKLNEFVAQNPKAGKVISAYKTTFTAPINLADKGINFLLSRKETPNPSGTFNPKISATNLYNSMRGWGTNEKLFFDTLSPLSRSQRIDVREYYDKNGVGKKLGTLELSVRGEFGGAELTRAIDLIEL